MDFLNFNFREIANQTWNKPTKNDFFICLLFAGYCGWFAFHNPYWVHILDSANLMFHEAGHPIFGALFGSRIMVYGGTLGQLCFPALGAVSFWLKREATSFAIMLIWFFENIWNIARYLADARAQILPLVGGGEHDWTEILTRWGLLANDLKIANSLKNFASVGVVITISWLYLKFQEIDIASK